MILSWAALTLYSVWLGVFGLAAKPTGAKIPLNEATAAPASPASHSATAVSSPKDSPLQMKGASSAAVQPQPAAPLSQKPAAAAATQTPNPQPEASAPAGPVTITTQPQPAAPTAAAPPTSASAPIPPPRPAEPTAQLSVSGPGLNFTTNLAINPGLTSVYDLLAEGAAAQGLAVSKTGQGGSVFVTAIGNLKNSGGHYWLYYLNGVFARTGAGSQMLQAGDIVEWRFE